LLNVEFSNLFFNQQSKIINDPPSKAGGLQPTLLKLETLKLRNLETLKP